MSGVLALARELPYPPNAGDRIVTYGFLRALADRGHDVHVLAYERGDDAGPAAALGSFCESVALAPRSASSLPAPLRKAVRAVRGRSDVMAMFDSSAFPAAAADRIRAVAPDVVLAQHPYMGQFFLSERVEAALSAVGATPVTSAHVVEYAAHRRQRRHADDLRTRLALAAEVPRLRREELAVYDRSARTLVLGREDRRELTGAVSGPVHYQRVGLDVETYEPADRVRCDSTETGDSRDGTARLLFFGSYDWFPNADAARYLCERIFPGVRAAVDDAELLLAGRGASDEIAAYGDRPGITFLGEVAELAGLVRDATAVVAPLRVGGGTRIKILESMAWGRPVVTTPAGAEGIEAPPGEAISVAEGRAEFVSECVRLLARPEERARLAAGARRTVEDRYDLPAVAPALERRLGLD